MNTTKEDFKNTYDDNISVSSDEEIYDEDITYYNYVKEDDPEHEDFIFDKELLENIEWRMIKIGDNNLRISSSGKIQYMDISIFYITSGNRYPGTPYRYIDIKVSKNDIKRFFVHDLVWRVFNHTPEEEWEIRHSNYTPLDKDNCYINSLNYLEVYKKDRIYTDFRKLNTI
jgi:hypothetical protein